MSPPYLVEHPEFGKPRAVEADNPRRARAYTAKEFSVRRLSSREIFELGQRGIDLVDITARKRG